MTYHVSYFEDPKELIEAVEKKIKEIGRDLTPQELNIFIDEYAVEHNKVVSASEKEFDSGKITGDLRESGVKVRNLNEEHEKERRKKEKE